MWGFLKSDNFVKIVGIIAIGLAIKFLTLVEFSAYLRMFTDAAAQLGQAMGW